MDELLAAARVPVFLLDEFQVVRPGEQGTVEDIEKHAANQGIDVVKIDLDAQFRCGGSEEYLLWVKRLLGLVPGGPTEWLGDPHFDVEVVDSPVRDGGLPRDQARRRLLRPHGRRLLLALERPPT